jgi:hypothetical protein
LECKAIDLPRVIASSRDAEQLMPKQAKGGKYGKWTEASDKIEDTLILGCDSELMGDLVKAVLHEGDAVLFGVTRDGGSIRVILMSGDDKSSKYFTSAEELAVFCKDISQTLLASTD